MAAAESRSLYLQVCDVKISNFCFYWGGTTGIKMLIARSCSQTSLAAALKSGKHLKLRQLPASGPAVTYGSVRFNGRPTKSRRMDAFQEVRDN